MCMYMCVRRRRRRRRCRCRCVCTSVNRQLRADFWQVAVVAWVICRAGQNPIYTV